MTRTGDLPAIGQPLSAPGIGVDSVERILQRARDHLGLDVAFVAEVTVDGHRVFRHVVSGADETAPPVGHADPLGETYCGMILDGSLPAVTPDTSVVSALQRLPVTHALGIGCYIGVPIELPDGALYGTLCAYGHTADMSLNDRDADTLRFLATLIAERIEADALGRLAWQAEHDRIAEVLTDGVQIVFQPIVDLTSGRAVGYEALSRFGVEPPLSPDVAYAMAARVGLGVDLELRAAAGALERLPELPDDLYVSINLSATALASPATTQLLAGAPLHRIVVELTEHESEIGDDALAALTALRARGMRLAMDDLGSGYSGLARVLRLAPDVIKLDRSLISGVVTDPARQALAVAAAGFARSIGARLVAEGIESAAECTAMRELGATDGQGYYLGRPHRRPWSVVPPGTAILAAAPTLVRRRALRDWLGIALVAVLAYAATSLAVAADLLPSSRDGVALLAQVAVTVIAGALTAVVVVTRRARRWRRDAEGLREAQHRLAQAHAELSRLRL
jgi:EAL domain-containing protein (putative c-di-GMP-specific phosphodiesterase class I)